MKLKIYFLLVLCLTIISSCTITQEYHFNKDLSGTVKSSIDLSMLMSFMQGQESEEKLKLFNDSLNNSFGKMIEKLEQAGATNAKAQWVANNTVIEISYDFKNIDVLNETMKSSNSAASSPFLSLNSNNKNPLFEVKRNKVIYHGVSLKADSLFDNEKMKSMANYYRYKMVFSFEREVKKVKNSSAKIGNDNKSVFVEGSLFDFFSKDFDPVIEIKLKK